MLANLVALNIFWLKGLFHEDGANPIFFGTGFFG